MEKEDSTKVQVVQGGKLAAIQLQTGQGEGHETKMEDGIDAKVVGVKREELEEMKYGIEESKNLKNVGDTAEAHVTSECSESKQQQQQFPDVLQDLNDAMLEQEFTKLMSNEEIRDDPSKLVLPDPKLTFNDLFQDLHHDEYVCDEVKQK